MRNWSAGSCLLAFLVVAGCYHAVVETDLPPSNILISKPWAASWIYGLVPPSTISTAARCPGGVAKVETQLSFLNQLVGFLTMGIYTPMEIIVTCAAAESASLGGAEMLHVDIAAGPDKIQEVFHLAAQQAVQRGEPVLVRLDGSD